MKRLLLTLAFFGALVLLPAQAMAAHFWKIQMSDPSTAQQTRAFNLDYTTLSTDEADKITVKLLQNGSQIGSQTTIAGGDSGTFFVTVPADGSYTYNLTASSNNDGSSKSTTSKIVTVATPIEGQPSQITSTNQTDGANGNASNLNGEGTNTDGSADGQVESETTNGGTVDGDAASTDGDGDNDKNNDNSTSDVLTYGLIVIVAAGLAYYLYKLYQDRKLGE